MAPDKVAALEERLRTIAPLKHLNLCGRLREEVRAPRRMPIVSKWTRTETVQEFAGGRIQLAS